MKKILSEKQLEALSYGRRGGYWKHTQKYKDKMSKLMKNNNPMTGKFGNKHPRWTREKLECNNCGNIIYKPKCLVKRSKRHFCSVDCKKEWFENNRKTHPYYYYGKDWLMIRKQVIKRDKNQCKRCKSKKRLHVHHKEKWLETNNNDLSNLITLCHSCHRKVESRVVQF
jgi:hypothetical protein